MPFCNCFLPHQRGTRLGARNRAEGWPFFLHEGRRGAAVALGKAVHRRGKKQEKVTKTGSKWDPGALWGGPGPHLGPLWAQIWLFEGPIGRPSCPMLALWGHFLVQFLA